MIAMKNHKCMMLIMAAAAAMLAAAGCDKGREDIFARTPTTLAPVTLNDSLAIVSSTFERVYLVSYDEADHSPVVSSVRVGRDPTKAVASADGTKLFVLCRGAVEGEVSRHDARPPSLQVIDAEALAVSSYTLPAPFTGMAESPGGRWLVAYFSAPVAGSNPNLLAIVDLEQDPSQDNPVVLAIRSLGSSPLAITFLEGIDVAVPDAGVVKKNLALVLSESYVTLVDLDQPARTEISVRLAVPGLDQSVIPSAEDVLVIDDPEGLSSRVLLRSDNASDIFSMTFIGAAPQIPDGNDYSISLNQLSVDINPTAAPADMVLFEEEGKTLVLATNRISGSIAVLDPETTMVTKILTDFPTDKIHILEEGRSALLYTPTVGMTPGEEMAYFVTFEGILEMKEMNLEEFSFGGLLGTLIPVPGRDFAAFTLSGQSQNLFFLDLRTREMHQVFLSGSAESAQFLMVPDGSAMVINPRNLREVWFIDDMTSYTVTRVILDETVDSMALLEASGTIVLDHGYPEGYVTFLDADDPGRSGAVSLWGFIFDGVLSIDPDEYPLAQGD
jgi:hypothetical protein